MSLHEERSHGEFVRRGIGHLSLDQSQFNGDEYIIGYPPNGNVEIENGFPKPSNFGKSRKSYGNQTLFRRKTSANPLSIFMKKVLTQDLYRNSIIIGNGEWLSYAYQSLVELRVEPKSVSRKNNQIIAIDCGLNGVNLKVLDSFLGEKQVPFSSKPFFPWIFNSEENYNYSGKIPEVSWFIKNTDSEENMKEKLDFVNNFPSGLWNFKEQLEKVLFEEVLSMTYQALDLISATYDLQSHLQNQLRIDMPYFNLFKNSATLAGFSYILMQKFCLTQYPIHCVPNTETGQDTCRTSR